MSEESHLIFISYASPDRERVLPFFEWLDNQGFNVWMDVRRLKPGQNWDFEIKHALGKATFVLSFISKLSFDRRGYIQRELKLALDKRTEKLVDDIYLIPVLLDDDVQIPDQVRDLQAIKASAPRCREQIADALQHQLQRLGFERREIQEKEQLYWTSRVKREEWDGIPGYEVELEFLEFQSDIYPNVSEIGAYIQGELLPRLFEHRADKFIPSPEDYNYGQDKYSRTNTYEAHCGEPVIVGKIISIDYLIYWNGAGAAHPNHDFQTYSFLLEPVTQIKSLQDIFREPDTALETVQTEARGQLYQIRVEDDTEDEDIKLDREWINNGTQTWEDFASFIFRADGIEISFAPYRIAPYAFGSHSVEIPYKRIVALMRNEYVSALQIQHLTWTTQK